MGIFSFLFKRKSLGRIEEAVLIVLYEAGEEGMTPEDIQQAIEDKRLLEMTNREFRKYKNDVIKSMRQKAGVI